MSTHTTMENTLVLILSLFREYVCLMEQQNTRLPNTNVFFFFFFFFTICFCFLLLYTTISRFGIKVKSCFDVLFFLFFSRARTGYHFAPSSIRLLYLYLIWNPKNSLPSWPSGYRVIHRMRRSWARLPSPTILFFCARYCFLITIFMIFFHPNVS